MSFDARKASERITRLVAETGRSERQISIAATGKPDALKDIRRNREPSWTRAEGLARELGCSPAYLLGESDQRYANGDEDFYVPVRQFSQATLSAGPGAVVEHEFETGELKFRRKWLGRVTNSSPERLVVLPVRGDSMYPTICDGDVVMVDLGQREVVSTRIYALRQFDGLKVKRLNRSPDGGVIIKSDNPYESEYLMDGDVEIVGRAIWLGRSI